MTGVYVVVLSVVVLVEMAVILHDDMSIRRMRGRILEGNRRRDEQVKEAVKLEMEKMERKEQGISIEMSEIKNDKR